MLEEKPLQEERFAEVPWTIRQTCTGILLTLVPWLLITVGTTFLNGRVTHHAAITRGEDLLNAIVTFILSALIEGAFLIAPLYYALRPYRAYPRSRRMGLALRALGFNGFAVRSALLWIIGLIVAILIFDVLYSQLIAIFHLNLRTNDQLVLEMSKSAPLTTYAVLLAAVIVAPFCEEIFFRGFVFPGLLKVMSVVMAVISCAFLFALAHGDIGSLVVLFVIGLALSFLRWHTRSIWPCIILHMLNNGISALLIVAVMLGIVHA